MAEVSTAQTTTPMIYLSRPPESVQFSAARRGVGGRLGGGKLVAKQRLILLPSGRTRAAH
eukprot:3944627-Pyramimonas_sp.AAC.1